MDEDKDKTELKLMEEELTREIKGRPHFVVSIPECIKGIRNEHVKDKGVMELIVAEVHRHMTPNGVGDNNHNKRGREEKLDKMEIEEPKPRAKEPPKKEEENKRQKLPVVPGYDVQLWADVSPDFLFKQYLIYHTMCAIQPNYEAALEAAKETDAGRKTMRILSAIKCIAGSVASRAGSHVPPEAFQIMQRTTTLIAFPTQEKLDDVMECSVTRQKTKKGKAYMMTFKINYKDGPATVVQEFQKVMNEEWMRFFVNWALLSLRDKAFRAMAQKKIKEEMANSPNLPPINLASAVTKPDFVSECMVYLKKPLIYFYSNHCTDEQRKELTDHFGKGWFS